MYNFTEGNRNQFMTQMPAILNPLGHETTEAGLNKIWDTYTYNKGKGTRPSLAEILSRHPNWDPETLCIRLTEEYNTSIDKKKINEFTDFLFARLDKWCEAREVKFACMTRKEVRNGIERLRKTINAIDRIPYRPVTVMGMSFDELIAEYRRLDAIDDKFFGMNTFNERYLTRDDNQKARAILSVISNLKEYYDNTLNSDMANFLNDCAKHFFPVDAEGKPIRKVRFSANQKTSKAISKFFALVGDEFVKFKDIQTLHWTDQSGNPHSREVDMGWNGKFSSYGDGINPIKVKRYTFISINPLDYITMSFGNGWSSCHTPDYQNLRPNNGDHTYQGCYQSGTMSYMLDTSSIIMYTTKDDIDITRPWTADKVHRCMFHLGKEKFIQGRLYPDGRDDSDNPDTITIASCFRNIFQRVISECLGVTNLWIIKRGRNEYYTESYGTHYRDYLNYRDTLTCLLKGSTNTSKIKIGHTPICLVCGEEHGNERSLHCGIDHNCLVAQGYVKCHRCGVMLHRSNAIHDLDTDRWYDDSYCANNDSVYYCANVDEWHSENVYQDSNTGVFFYDPDETHIEIGYQTFMNEESAIAYGYKRDENGNWTR